MKIFFSIITVTYNSKENLLRTIRSVQSQNYKNYSHLIKDGLSNDKTNEIDFTKLENTKFFESKDLGIYDAMNQALELVNNEFIIYLNSGDEFFSNNTLKKLSKQIKSNPNYYSYCGGTLQIDPFNNSFKRLIGLSRLYKYLPLAQLPHPSLITRKSILTKLKNPFDERLKIAGDYKQQLILRKKNLWKVYYIKDIISVMPIGGESNKNQLSIFEGYKETFLFSYKLFKFLSFYIILLKVFLNLYSRIYKIKINKLIN